MAKTLGERQAHTEALMVAHLEICEAHWQSIDARLERLNGDVADNSKFRLQQNAVLNALAFAWASVMIPLAVIAIAVLT